MLARTKIALGIALILACVVVGAGLTVMSVRQQRAAATEVEHAANMVTNEVIALLRAASRIKLDVVQVQQFLSDVSATRGQDGLDDGFAKAQAFADSFPRDVATATAAAERLGRGDIVEALARTASLFPPYYETGRRMAQGYVEGGPPVGNRLMPAFDKASEAMQQGADLLLALIELATDGYAATLNARISGIEVDGDAILRHSIVSGLLAIVVVVGIGAWMFTGVIRPLSMMAAAMRRLAGGDLALEVPGQRRADEVGEMAKAVLVFRDSMRRAHDLAAEQERTQQRAADEKAAALRRMAETIEGETAKSLDDVRTSTSAMTATADQMAASAGRTDDAAGSAAAAASLALRNVESVASASEQLAASIGEIGRQASESAKVVGRAVTASLKTRESIEALTRRVEQIGSVADVIGEIAARTNLLALNATIEAARAGESGKGFAVVASEVKQLATQTARSTSEIATHIAEVRAATEHSVVAVRRIEETIAEVNGIAGSIAAAVEQQSAATAEIARNVTETANAAHEMTSQSSQVSSEAAETGRRAGEVRNSAVHLNAAMEELRQSVIRVVRTATPEVDRRADTRFPIDRPGNLAVGGVTHKVMVADMSDGGAQLCGAPDLRIGATATLSVEGVAEPLPALVRNVSGNDVNLTFRLDDAAAARFSGTAERLARRRAA